MALGRLSLTSSVYKLLISANQYGVRAQFLNCTRRCNIEDQVLLFNTGHVRFKEKRPAMEARSEECNLCGAAEQIKTGKLN